MWNCVSIICNNYPGGSHVAAAAKSCNLYLLKLTSSFILYTYLHLNSVSLLIRYHPRCFFDWMLLISLVKC